MTATDEAELARQMEKAEQENAEVAGDDDEEEIEGQMFSAGEEGENGEGEAGSGEEDWNSDFYICNKNAIYWPVCNSNIACYYQRTATTSCMVLLHTKNGVNSKLYEKLSILFL